MSRRSGWVRVAVAIAAAALVVTACSNGHQDATVRVSPRTSALTKPMSVRISGLSPGDVFTVALSSVDAKHTHWVSAARFRANSAGVIDVDQASSIGGSYTGVHPMGLVQALSPKPTVTDSRAYARSGRESFDLRVTAADGGTMGRATFHRQRSRGVRTSTQTVPRQGFDGVYHQAPHSRSPRPAVLSLGGSEGGVSSAALGEGLAAAGYSTLSIAYFHAPGLPKYLVKIPLEYFAHALRWLRAQPGVDPHRIYISGDSRGSEAAELVAVHYPRLLHGVILGVPSNVAYAGLVGGVGLSTYTTDKSAWTFHGRQVPFVFVRGSEPTTKGDAVIPVERIHAPMFLTCGGADKLWQSCPMSQAIVARLDAHHDRYQHDLAVYPDAGHSVGGLVPYEPAVLLATDRLRGRYRLANQFARASVWPRLLHFLDVTARR